VQDSPNEPSGESNPGKQEILAHLHRKKLLRIPLSHPFTATFIVNTDGIISEVDVYFLEPGGLKIPIRGFETYKPLRAFIFPT